MERGKNKQQRNKTKINKEKQGKKAGNTNTNFVVYKNIYCFLIVISFVRLCTLTHRIVWVWHSVEWTDTQWILVQNEEVCVIFLLDKFSQQFLIWSAMKKQTSSIINKLTDIITDRKKDRRTLRQTYKWITIQIDIQTDRQMIDRQTQTDRQIDMQTYKQTDKQMIDRQIERHTDRQMDIQTDRKMDRQMNRELGISHSQIQTNSKTN